MREAKKVCEQTGTGASTRNGSGRSLPSKKNALVGLTLASLLSPWACAPELVVGRWDCVTPAEGGASAAGDPPPADQAITLPWTTGFEDGFCGFYSAGGFCYVNPAASYEVTSSPVHSGTSAAAFHIAGDPAVDGLQARCARQGTLPAAAYYGAWFFIPDAVTATDNWNLFHFDGDTADVKHGLWDVSLAVGADGNLYAFVFDFLRMLIRLPTGPADVPIGAWFHLEVYWERAADNTGSFELYVDGALALSLTDLATDDTEIGQWYVGNLAKSLTPRPNTLYVDDVTIALERQGGP